MKKHEEYIRKRWNFLGTVTGENNEIIQDIWSSAGTRTECLHNELCPTVSKVTTIRSSSETLRNTTPNLVSDSMNWLRLCQDVPYRYVIQTAITSTCNTIRHSHDNCNKRLSIWPITVAVRCKARNAFARSNTGIVGSDPTRDMDVSEFIFCLCCPV
jgi:hypothetical protein